MARRRHRQHRRHHTALARATENPIVESGLGEIGVGVGAGALLGLLGYAVNQSAINSGSANAITGLTMPMAALSGAFSGLLISGAVVAAQKL